ncbi:16S rRNA (cytidine(1402)-2'-O)-methyltransferase [Quadrisphaera sp. INWT6]|uniref:16S rRNA (cytidine(1402)-2'-O)-methyltransferase n=1 Tax=Quadrisphaera sp. INWT6 TaxID=2596917 RepID=UPI0028161C88|nr:16S rRNA (cytidine(1402)-2'-O)-methyltransferase [Quadrisphaera sp. INWT6]
MSEHLAPAGRVVLAGTPIGNPEDAPPRLAAALATADVIAAEDTRRLRRLCAALGVVPTGRVVSSHEHNEGARGADLVEAAAQGATVLVVTDAGMPTVSDPGYRVVVAAAEAGVRVTTLPGPSAVLAALAVSGLATDRFCFEGFLPRKAGERASALAELARERRTMVFFEAPHRLAVSLEAMGEAFGADRPAAVCRELTKTHEEVRRGPLAELAAWAGELAKIGEVTVVVGGAPESAADPQRALAEVLERVAAGERLKEAVADVAAATGWAGATCTRRRSQPAADHPPLTARR